MSVSPGNTINQVTSRVGSAVESLASRGTQLLGNFKESLKGIARETAQLASTRTNLSLEKFSRTDEYLKKAAREPEVNPVIALKKMGEKLMRLFSSNQDYLKKHRMLGQELAKSGIHNAKNSEDLLNGIREKSKEVAQAGQEAFANLDHTDEFIILTSLASEEQARLQENAALAGRAPATSSSFLRLVNEALEQYSHSFETIEAELAAYEASFIRNKKRIDDEKAAKKWRHDYSWVATLKEEELQNPLLIVARFTKNKGGSGGQQGQSRGEPELSEDILEELIDLGRGVVAQLESEISRKNKTYLVMTRRALHNIEHLITFNRAIDDYMRLLMVTQFYSKKVEEEKHYHSPRERKRLREEREERERGEKQSQEKENQEDLDNENPFKTSAFMGSIISVISNTNVNFSSFLNFANKYISKFSGREIIEGSLEVSTSIKRMLFINKLYRLLMEYMPPFMYGDGERGKTQQRRVYIALKKIYELFNDRNIEVGGEKEEDPPVIQKFDNAPIFHIRKDLEDE